MRLANFFRITGVGSSVHWMPLVFLGRSHDLRASFRRTRTTCRRVHRHRFRSPQRFEAFAHFLSQHPEWRSRISFLQIAPPSREEVPEYRELRSRLERLAGATNGRYAEPDWMPIRYVNRSFNQATLAGFYRAADIAVVTPLRDGMNLVAKEFVAAQDAEDPGVLILSSFAGAADELRQAIIINPFDADDIAESFVAALEMPLAERRERWQAMFDYLVRNDVVAWRTRYLDALTEDAPRAAA